MKPSLPSPSPVTQPPTNRASRHHLLCCPTRLSLEVSLTTPSTIRAFSAYYDRDKLPLVLRSFQMPSLSTNHMPMWPTLMLHPSNGVARKRYIHRCDVQQPQAEGCDDATDWRLSYRFNTSTLTLCGWFLWRTRQATYDREVLVLHKVLFVEKPAWCVHPAEVSQLSETNVHAHVTSKYKCVDRCFKCLNGVWLPLHPLS